MSKLYYTNDNGDYVDILRSGDVEANPGPPLTQEVKNKIDELIEMLTQ